MARSVEQLGSGRYKVRFRLNGKQTSETFDRRKDAETFAKWLDALGAQGALDQLYAGEQDNTVPTLDQLAADHIKHLTGVEPGTRIKYERLWERVWAPHIGAVRSDHINRDAIALAINELGEHYSAKSLQNQRGLLSGVLDRGVDQGYLRKNPAKGIRLPRSGEAEKEEMVLLTADEFGSVVERMHPFFVPYVEVLVGTGVRWGEAVALQPQHWRAPNLHIRRALKWSPDSNRRFGPPKTKRGRRTIATDGRVRENIERAAHGKNADDFLFTALRGGMILHRTFWSRVWLPAVDHLTPRPRIHDLRHTHASWLLAQGVPIHIVSRRLGHESIQTTVDTYGHLLPDAQQQAAQAASLDFLPPRAIG